MKKRVISLVLAAATAFSLVACGGKAEPTAAKTEAAQTAAANTEAAKTEAADDADADKAESDAKAETYIYTDDVGREVEIPKEVTRIVPSASMAQIVLMTIAPEKFVGLGAKLSEKSKGIIPEYLYELPFFGSLYAGPELNVEELAMTEPQLIIDVGEPKKSLKEDLDSLQSQTLIPAVYVAADLKGMPETYRKLGKLLGKEERGEALAAFCEKVYSRTEAIMEKVGDKKVNCLFVLGDEGLNVIASSSYHAELLDMLTNNLAVVDNPISKGSGNEVTMEQISVWNPEFVIFGPDSIYSDVKNMETWNQIAAIANDNYVEVPGVPYNWLNLPPSVQRYLGLIWLPAELYPEYCDYDVKEEIKAFFKLFYDCELTDEQYNAITEKAFTK